MWSLKEIVSVNHIYNEQKEFVSLNGHFKFKIHR